MQSSVRTDDEREMPGNPRDVITVAERRFPVRIKVGVPTRRFRPTVFRNYGVPGGELRGRGMGNDTVRDARSAQRRCAYLLYRCPLGSAFVARWCAGYKVE